MERSAYAEMAAIDEDHWWYRARRRIVSDIIAARAQLPASPEIVEIGCGTGSNLQILTPFGRVTAIEPDGEARAYAARRSEATVLEGRLPDGLPLAHHTMDLAVMLDVLEHVDDDVAALKAVTAVLKPGARFVLTVPALPALWSAHDVEHHHKRRYTRQTFQGVLKQAGLEIELISYFNTLLFPLIAGIRWMKTLMGSTETDTGMPPRGLNTWLEGIFALERHLIGRLTLPFGVSLITVARVPQAHVETPLHHPTGSHG